MKAKKKISICKGINGQGIPKGMTVASHYNHGDLADKINQMEVPCLKIIDLRCSCLDIRFDEK